MVDEFDKIVDVVSNSILFTKGLLLRRNVRHEFAIDLVFVALGIRAGYLVDRIPPLDDASQIFGGIIEGLRQSERTKHIFQNVTHLYESCSGQSYFVNVPMTASRKESDMPRFVELCSTSEPSEMSEPPQTIVQIFDEIKGLLSTDLPSSVVINTEHTPAMSIGLAGILLEYPVAHIPSETSTDISLLLSHVPLDLYRCEIHWEAKKHTLFQFSCPAMLKGLAPTDILDDLRSRFATRCQSTSGWALQFHHEQVVLDSVSL